MDEAVYGAVGDQGRQFTLGRAIPGHDQHYVGQLAVQALRQLCRHGRLGGAFPGIDEHDSRLTAHELAGKGRLIWDYREAAGGNHTA
ncbi:MAG: hypothetical protein WA825_17720 [Steroidobacteraceae bacterium]